MFSREYSAFQEALLGWFDQNQRPLPWRKAYLPYETWISEVMLQQTRVQTMLPYYHRWMARFPDIGSVAAATVEELLKHWEGLGYYSRAMNIHKAARIIMERHGGVFPRSRRDILRLPGIGPYTAAAIAGLAYNDDAAAVDGNIERVFARLFNIDAPVKAKSSRDFIRAKAEELIPRGEARRFNQALMELGASICLPRKADCAKCPVTRFCEAFRLGIVDRRPVRQPQKKLVPIEAAIGVLALNGRILIQRRPPTGLMPGLWEFPGGKTESGETPEEALVREFREELGLEVRCVEKIAFIRHNYTSFKVELHAFLCELCDSTNPPEFQDTDEIRWTPRSDLDRYAFPAANRRLIQLLAGMEKWKETET